MILHEHYDNCDYKKLLSNTDGLKNVSEHNLKKITLDRINYLVKIYNSCPDEVKTEFKRRVEYHLESIYDKKIKITWPNVIDKYIIGKTLRYLRVTAHSVHKLLPVTILLEIELNEAIKECKDKDENNKYTRDKDVIEMYNMYNSLSDSDRLKIKIWILNYLRRDEEFGKKIINNYLLPEVDFYQIMKISKKNIKGKEFIKDLLKELTVVFFNNNIDRKYRLK